MTRNLRHALAMLTALAAIFSGVFIIASQTAYASTTPAVCPNLVGWSPNPDEVADRSPVSKPEGLEFSNTDLTHHAAPSGLTLADLKPGTYVASKTPDQPSFFSVEVSGDDGKYGTLRWNPSLGTSGEWEATSQGQQHHDTDPAALADAFPIHLSHHVVRFGVGYTENPAGTVTTVVSSVTFQGVTYSLTCQPQTTSPAPVVTTTSPAPHQSSTSAAPHSSSAKPHTSSSAAAGGSSLPVTGPPVGLLVGGAVSLLILGSAAYLVARRRRTTFQA